MKYLCVCLGLLTTCLLPPQVAIQGSRSRRLFAKLDLKVNTDNPSYNAAYKSPKWFVDVLQDLKISDQFDEKATAKDDIHMLLKPKPYSHKFLFSPIKSGERATIKVEVVQGLPIDELGYESNITDKELADSWEAKDMADVIFTPLRIIFKDNYGTGENLTVSQFKNRYGGLYDPFGENPATWNVTVQGKLTIKKGERNPESTFEAGSGGKKKRGAAPVVFILSAAFLLLSIVVYIFTRKEKRRPSNLNNLKQPLALEIKPTPKQASQFPG